MGKDTIDDLASLKSADLQKIYLSGALVGGGGVCMIFLLPQPSTFLSTIGGVGALCLLVGARMTMRIARRIEHMNRS